MLQLNSTLFLQIINFLLLMWILNRLIFRPFLKMVEEREAKTLGARTQAGDLTVEAEDLKKKYESGVSEATSQGVSSKEMQRREGQSMGEGIVSETRTKSSDYISNARRDLEASVSEVRKELVQLSINFSEEMTGKILGRDIR
ncbi:MAG: ATP synthase F0 subunit B [Deltaproteobacteria bacterium]|jgi:F-type H+-transporting ATPase subunit b|nr:ATP synthase F0 subunit B [Deltaproteobacteria bacterium]MCK5422622.1 ATP synthase F0 subunit B [Deltaproteobacteria bacterium]